MDEKGQILRRFIEFAHSKVGDKHGWQKKFALLIEMSPQQMNDIVAERAPIGPTIIEKIRGKFPENAEWIRSGIKNKRYEIQKENEEMNLIRERLEQTTAELEAFKSMFNEETQKKILSTVKYPTTRKKH